MRIEVICTGDEVLTGKITRRIKGGLVVDLMGLDAFLPGSQIDVKAIIAAVDEAGYEAVGIA